MRLKPITLEYVIDKVRRIHKMAGDPEAAHGAEDELYRELLHAIAEDCCDDPRGCARQALMTQGIDFPRWCA